MNENTIENKENAIEKAIENKENTKKIINLSLRKEYKKIYRKDNAFSSFENESQNKLDLRNVSQASACDLLIDKQIKNNVAINKVYKACIDFVMTNDVYFKNYDNNKELIIARLKRHMTSDNMQRLSKRAISLT